MNDKRKERKQKMAVNKNGIVVLGAVFVDIKGFPEDVYIPDGRNAGKVEYVHGGVSRNVVEDIANIELRPTFLGIVDNSALGEEVIHKLQRHKVNTEYMQTVPGGMGTCVQKNPDCLLLLLQHLHSHCVWIPESEIFHFLLHRLPG